MGPTRRAYPTRGISAYGIAGLVGLGAIVAALIVLAPELVPILTAGEDAASRAEGGTGYTASKIEITEQGLEHVFERHFTDGALSAGKSVFYDMSVLHE